MTVGNWIKESCGYWGIPYSDSLYFSLAEDMDENETMTADDKEKIEVNLFKHIPYMLSGVSQVSESGFSMSMNTEGIKGLYSYLFKKYGSKYGLTDDLGILNTIEDKTDVW